MANDHEGELHEVETIARRIEEEKVTEKRRRNIVIYRVMELQTESVEDRKRDDTSFIRNMVEKDWASTLTKQILSSFTDLAERKKVKKDHCWSSSLERRKSRR